VRLQFSPRIVAWVVVLSAAVAGCAMDAAQTAEMSRVPVAVRSGQADLLVQPVEQGVSPDEVMAAVQKIVGASPNCIAWPSLWLEETEARRVVRARYDLMRRDWGADVTDEAQQRMDEFVDMGFLAKRARNDVAPGIVEYTVTDAGRAYLSGWPFGGSSPKFCAPSERRVVAVIGTQYGRYPCGNLRVRFSYEGPDHPSWAHSEAARARAAQSLNPPAGMGEVTLGREWFPRNAVPDGFANGSLQSVCLDPTQTQPVGTDLNLSAGGGS